MLLYCHQDASNLLADSMTESSHDNHITGGRPRHTEVLTGRPYGAPVIYSDQALKLLVYLVHLTI